MNTNPNAYDLTKLEHFSILIFQSKVAAQEAAKDTDSRYVSRVSKGLTRQMAQSAVYEANVLIEALNEYHDIESRKGEKFFYPLPETFKDILGLDEEKKSERAEFMAKLMGDDIKDTKESETEENL